MRAWVILGGGFVILALAGCAKIQVGDHNAASDYAGTPKRIFVVSGIDAAFDKRAPETFAETATATLANCAIATAIYRPSSVELDVEEKARARVEAFNPDLLLSVRLTNRLIRDGAVVVDSYTLVLRDVARKHDVWRARMAISGSALFSDRGGLGGRFADRMVRQLVADNVLKTCPAFPPAAPD